MMDDISQETEIISFDERGREVVNTLISGLVRYDLMSVDNLCKSDEPNIKDAWESLSVQQQEVFKDSFLAALQDLSSLKQKQRTAAALAGRIRSRLRITKNAPNSKVSASNSESRHETAPDLITRLRQKHRYEALHCLLLGEFDGIDPAIGDAACEMRPGFILDLSERLHGILASIGMRRPVVDLLVEAYRRRHDGDAADDTIKTLEDIAEDDPKYDDIRLWDYLLRAIQHDDDPIDVPQFLEYCRTYTVAASFTLDEFGLPVSSRLKRRHLLVTTDGVCGLAEMTKKIMLHMAERVAQAMQQQQWSAEAAVAQAAQVLTDCQVYKDSDHGRLPLLPIFEALRVILTYECLKDRPLILGIIRIGYTRSSGDLRFRLLGATPMALIPQEDDGRYVLARDISTIIRQPGIVFRSFSVVDLDGHDQGLLNPQLSVVDLRQVLARRDLLADLMKYAAVHPPFADGATIAPFAAVAEGASYGMDQDKFEGVLAGLYSLLHSQASLREELNALRRAVIGTGEVDLRYSERDGRNMIRRLARPLSFSPIHIYAGTLSSELEWLSRLNYNMRDVWVGDQFCLNRCRSVVMESMSETISAVA